MMEHSGLFEFFAEEESFISVIEDILKDPDLSKDTYEDSYDEVFYFISVGLLYYSESVVLELVDEAERRFLNGK